MDSINFDINNALKHYMDDPASIPTPEADSALIDCENEPESLGDNGLINSILNPIVDAVAENPDAITRAHIFDSLQFLLKCASILFWFPYVPVSLVPKATTPHPLVCGIDIATHDH